MCPQTELTHYPDAFFEAQDVLVNALDNVEARRYMDRSGMEHISQGIGERSDTRQVRQGTSVAGDREKVRRQVLQGTGGRSGRRQVVQGTGKDQVEDGS